jgi:tRNA threonylcarbamoyladenosine biosynthesis protein TsaB
LILLGYHLLFQFCHLSAGNLASAPLIDELIYTQVFGEQLEEKTPIEALILEEGVFGSWLQQGKVFFIGDAVEKVKQVVDHPNAIFLPETDYPLSARAMGQLAFEKFQVQAFEDLAYFVPNYLKEFKALQSTKNPLLKP